MTVKQLAEILSAQMINEGDFSREVVGGYAGDLLSFVIGKATENCAWYTIMTNVNVCAVATLVDPAVVVICENCKPDHALIERAKLQGINVIATPHDTYTAICKVANQL